MYRWELEMAALFCGPGVVGGLREVQLPHQDLACLLLTPPHQLHSNLITQYLDTNIKTTLINKHTNDKFLCYRAMAWLYGYVQTVTHIFIFIYTKSRLQMHLLFSEKLNSEALIYFSKLFQTVYTKIIIDTTKQVIL